MKNPFIMMTVMAAAARSAYAEMFGIVENPHERKRRDRTPGPSRPAGSKLSRMAAEKRIGLSHLGLNPSAK